MSLVWSNSYFWIHNTLNKHHTLLKTSVLSTPHQISTMQLSAPCLLNFFLRKVLHTLSEQFIPLVVPLQKSDRLNQLLWLKTIHPACQETGRIFLFTNSKTELFSDRGISHLFFPHSQFSTILIMANWGKFVPAFQGEGVFLLLLVLYFCFNTVYQSVQPGQVSMVQRLSEKSLGRTQVVTSPLRIPLQKNSLKSECCEGCSRGASSHLLLVLQGTKLSSLFLKWYFKASL